MGRPSQQDRRAIAELEGEAAQLSLAAPRFDVAERMRALLGVDVVFTHEVEHDDTGPRVVAPRISGAVPRLSSTMQVIDGKMPQGTWSPARPEPSQCNRVVAFPSFQAGIARPSSIWRGVGTARVEREARTEGILRYAHMWQRSEIFELSQVRALVCERGNLLVYVNAMHADGIPAAATYRFARAIPALRRRLRLERQLACGAGERLVLEAALDQLGRAAFVLGPRGQLLHTNAAGHAAYRDAMPRVRAAIRGEPSGFHVTRLGHGASTWYLAVEERAEPSAAGRARAAAIRWGLSAPQTRVLVGIAEGLANKTIAAELGLAENTVEYHVSRILARVGAPHRAALVARVWIETS